MKKKAVLSQREKSVRKTGLFLIITALLMLGLLSVYKTPLYENEHFGEVIGITQTHNEKGAKLIATVHLENGSRVLADIPIGLKIRDDGKARVIEGVSIIGIKSYTIVALDIEPEKKGI